MTLLHVQKRTKTNIHVVPTFFYESLKRRQNAVQPAPLKLKKRKRNSISHYISGEPGDLSLILVPINVSNSHWILCVSMHGTL